jgi:hypothetical protein
MGCEWSTPWLTRRAAAARRYAAGQDAGTSTAAAQHDGGNSSATHHSSAPRAAREAPPNKMDPQDFAWQGLAGQTHVKLPGSVAGQQFIIDGCQVRHSHRAVGGSQRTLVAQPCHCHCRHCIARIATCGSWTTARL